MVVMEFAGVSGDDGDRRFSLHHAVMYSNALGHTGATMISS